jgi:hypothetical protein
MKIACIGWGSLIWNLGNLKIQKRWFEDGPILPIEFTRISNDERVTLIIDKEAKPIQTLWALMTCNDIEEAKKSLKDREGTYISDIHSVNQNDKVTDEIKHEIQKWLNKKEIDCAIWTGLSYSKKTQRGRPSVDYIISYLRTLKDQQKQVAEEYIRKAPKQINTEYRIAIEKTFGWTPIEQGAKNTKSVLSLLE